MEYMCLYFTHLTLGTVELEGTTEREETYDRAAV